LKDKDSLDSYINTLFSDDITDWKADVADKGTAYITYAKADNQTI